MQYEAENRMDCEMHKLCEECMGKKHNIGTAQDLKVTCLSGANNINVPIFNGRYDTLHNKSHEGNTKIDNKKCDVLHDNSDEGGTSIAQDFEEVEEIQMISDSARNSSNSNDFIENSSSQESQRGKNQ